MMNNKSKKAIFSILLVAMMICTILPTTLAYNNENKIQNIKNFNVQHIWYVDDDRDPGWYDNNHLRTISEAILKAIDGDKIIVYMGYYKENIVINKMLEVTGSGADTSPPGVEGVDNTIIDGDYKDHTVKITANGVQISGFKIINSGTDKSGIYALHCHYNSIFLNILTQNSIGITLSDSNGNIITDNKICYNKNHGLWLYQSHMNDIRVNELFENSLDGLKIDFTATYNTVNANEAYNNQENGILINAASRSNSVVSNKLEGNSVGVKCIGTSDNNQYYYNDFKDNDQNALDTSKDIWTSDFEEGNHWSDFDEPSEGAYDNNSDGIVDKSYLVPGGENEDYFPLVTDGRPNPPQIECLNPDDDDKLYINKVYNFRVWTPEYINEYDEVSYTIYWEDGTKNETDFVNPKDGTVVTHTYTVEKRVQISARASVKVIGEIRDRVSDESNKITYQVPKNKEKPIFNNLNYFLKNLLSNDNIITFIRLLEKNQQRLISN